MTSHPEAPNVPTCTLPSPAALEAITTALTTGCWRCAADDSPTADVVQAHRPHHAGQAVDLLTALAAANLTVVEDRTDDEFGEQWGREVYPEVIVADLGLYDSPTQARREADRDRDRSRAKHPANADEFHTVRRTVHYGPWVRIP